MALLFAFGVMNLLWIAGLMLFVLMEKVVPYAGHRVASGGLVAIAAGIAINGDRLQSVASKRGRTSC